MLVRSHNLCVNQIDKADLQCQALKKKFHESFQNSWRIAKFKGNDFKVVASTGCGKQPLFYRQDEFLLSNIPSITKC